MDQPENDRQASDYICIKGEDYKSLCDVHELGGRFPSDIAGLGHVAARYPFRITPYFLSLIKTADDPLGLQVIPDERELSGGIPSMDPLCEGKQSPVPHLIHRYPDRVLLLVSDQCAMYCRYCMRKRIMGGPFRITRKSIDDGLNYIQQSPLVREVILSGGDPLMLTDRALERILGRLRDISHVEILRIHTRIPCTMPHRITKDISAMLARFHPLFVNIQFNHPDEITDQASAACSELADAGIPLGSQSVLLKGVNDDPAVLYDLFTKLLKIRVKPYYLHHPDVLKSAGHFRVPISVGLDILKKLQGRISGMAIPQYMIDLPGGGGKIPLLPESIKGRYNGILKVESFDGRVYEYPEGES